MHLAIVLNRPSNDLDCFFFVTSDFEMFTDSRKALHHVIRCLTYKSRLTLLGMTVWWSWFFAFVLISHVKVKLSAVMWCNIHWLDSFINKNKRLMMLLQDRPQLYRSAVFCTEFHSSLCRGWMHQWGAWPWVTWSHNPIRPWLRHSVLHIFLVWCGGHYLSI